MWWESGAYVGALSAMAGGLLALLGTIVKARYEAKEKTQDVGVQTSDRSVIRSDAVLETYRGRVELLERENKELQSLLRVEASTRGELSGKLHVAAQRGDHYKSLAERLTEGLEHANLQMKAIGREDISEPIEEHIEMADDALSEMTQRIHRKLLTGGRRDRKK